ncbi:hypothetical protein [Pseudomonas sp. J380]|uniref:hypothetical protein n=1 Tax=Pseudomonas sp. J380 TaxID=2605424 RepID=UPI001315FC6C|nr:hypothetical protein [Pseudomonas sp. J380]QHA95826.1 hypothetical protein FXO12_03755 [Pseudomonas sp. J380]
MRSDEDLVAKLSARLTEEIGNLPNDGKDHQLIIKIKGDHGNINLGNQTFDIRSGKEPPPRGSDRERECPQCAKPTWRYTQLCMHCDYDLYRHDQVEAEDQAKRHNEAVGVVMLKAVGVCVVVAVGSFLIKDHLPDPLQKWAIGITVATGFLAFVLLQAQR